MHQSLSNLISLICLCLFLITFGAGSTRSTTIDSLRLVDQSVEVDVPPRMLIIYKPTAPHLPEHVNDIGVVWLKVLVGRRGWVKDVVLLNPSKIDIIDNWAREAAYKNKFVPITKDGRTLEIWVVYRMEFPVGRAPSRGTVPLSAIVGPRLPFELQTVTKRNFAIPTKLPQVGMPPKAKKYRLGGAYVIWVKVLVEKDGKPKEVEVVSCRIPGVGFEKAARAATMESEFVPWKRRGKPKSHSFFHSVIFIDPDAKALTDLELYKRNFPRGRIKIEK